MNSDETDSKAKFGGYDDQVAQIYRQKYQTSKAPTGGYKTIAKLPQAEGDHIRGGAGEGEQSRIASKVKSSVNMGYFPDKWNCSEAKRMNKKLTKIYQQPADSYERIKMRESKGEMKRTLDKNRKDHVKTMFQGKGGSDAEPDAFEVSAYKKMFVFGDEEKRIVKEDPQEHNFKRDQHTIYANEFVKFKHALRLK